MDPAADEEFILVAEVEEVVVPFFGRVAGVGGAALVGDDEVVDEEGVGDEGAAEDAAGFQVAKSIGMGEVEEGGAEVRGEQEGSEGCAGFREGGWFEGVF